MKRRLLEARRVPSMRALEDAKLHSYRVHRPTSGREIVQGLPETHVAPEKRPIPRARPIVEPIVPLPAHASARGTQVVDHHDSTDVVAVRTWSETGPRATRSRSRLGVGWWVALALAATFFTASAVAWAF